MPNQVNEGRIADWLAALEARYLDRLTRQEVARALRALSSCYVERRAALARGAALEGAGKRAAFALFYAPLHFFVARHVVGALDAQPGVSRVLDLGCGTGAAGAAWAIESAAGISGLDVSGWAVAEANWTYARLGLRGRASRGDATRDIPGQPGRAVLLAYAVNELSVDDRDTLLPKLLGAARAGSPVLLIEPIARRLSPWWADWSAAWVAAGGRADEWRLPSALPRLQRDLAVAAGLDVRELKARSLYIRPPSHPASR